MQARANTRAAEARVIENASPLLPQLTSLDTYQRRTGNFAVTPGQLPKGTGSGMVGTGPCGNEPGTCNTLDTSNNWNFGVTLSQRLVDVSNFENYRAFKALARSQSDVEKTTMLSIEASVRTAFFNARAEKALIQVTKENLDNQQRHLDQIGGFVRVGTRPEIDLAQARTDFANAKVQLINAQNNYGVGLAQLNQAMGVDAAPDYDVADDELPAIAGEDDGLDPLLGEALKDRPEVQSLLEQVRAQELSLGSAKAAYAPTLGIATGVTANGIDITDMAYNWSATLTLGWNIFDGLRTWGNVKEAAANRDSFQAQVMAQKQQVRFDVENSLLVLKNAKAALEAAGEALLNAKERLRLAEGRYQAGVGSVIELGDAQVAFTTAAAQKVQAEYTLASARAQLLRALGRR
jgi:outer membrane protein